MDNSDYKWSDFCEKANLQIVIIDNGSGAEIHSENLKSQCNQVEAVGTLIVTPLKSPSEQQKMILQFESFAQNTTDYPDYMIKEKDIKGHISLAVKLYKGKYD